MRGGWQRRRDGGGGGRRRAGGGRANPVSEFEISDLGATSPAPAQARGKRQALVKRRSC